MSFKYFLEMALEEDVIEPNALRKFRKLRLKDVNLLDMLINKTVAIALEKGIIKSKSIIVVTTYTRAHYNQKSSCEILQERSKKLRKSVYAIDETMKYIFPTKNTVDKIENKILYWQELVKKVEKNEHLVAFPKVKEKLNLLNETLEDDIEHLQISSDADAKIRHKTVDSSFLGYKTHIAMSEERIITAATITTGEKNDSKELKTPVNKTMKASVKIDTIIGDAVYSEKGNIELANENNIKIVSRLNHSVTQGYRKKGRWVPI